MIFDRYEHEWRGQGLNGGMNGDGDGVNGSLGAGAEFAGGVVTGGNMGGSFNGNAISSSFSSSFNGAGFPGNFNRPGSGAGSETGFGNSVGTTGARDLGAEASEIAPSIWLGPHACLNHFMQQNPSVKILINCGDTLSFLKALNDNPVALSSDIVVLSLDPGFQHSADATATDHLRGFEKQFNRILQSYISHFYVNNSNNSTLIHEMPLNSQLSISSPILTGNLKAQFFNLTRLIKLFRSINQSSQVLVVSETGNSSISTGLCISYLMDTYNYNIQASFQMLKNARPSIVELNHNYYEDLLIVENLKKFAVENNAIKLKRPGVLMANCKLKRRGDEPVQEVCAGGKRRR